MGEKKNVLVFLVLLANNHIYSQEYFDKEISFSSKRAYIERRKLSKDSPYSVTNFLGHTLKDAFLLHRNIFEWDTLKTIGIVFPFYIASRMADEKLQCCFHDVETHKNINQLPSWCHDVARWMIAPTATYLGLHAFFGKDEEFRVTSQVMLVGIPFVIYANQIIKRFDSDACLRPWNEKFDCEQRVSGGLPSGHTAEGVYMAMLYGMRFGARAAVPLGLIAGVIGVTFISCNRHYLSQVVAGAGFGALYALAADKLVNSKLGNNVSLGLSVNDRGGPAFQLSYRF